MSLDSSSENLMVRLGYYLEPTQVGFHREPIHPHGRMKMPPIGPPSKLSWKGAGTVEISTVPAEYHWLWTLLIGSGKRPDLVGARSTDIIDYISDTRHWYTNCLYHNAAWTRLFSVSEVEGYLAEPFDPHPIAIMVVCLRLDVELYLFDETDGKLLGCFNRDVGNGARAKIGCVKGVFGWFSLMSRIPQEIDCVQTTDLGLESIKTACWKLWLNDRITGSDLELVEKFIAHFWGSQPSSRRIWEQRLVGLGTLSLPEIRKICSEAGLDPSGTRTQVVQRLKGTSLNPA